MLKILFGVTRIDKIRNEGQVRLSVLEKKVRGNRFPLTLLAYVI